MAPRRKNQVFRIPPNASTPHFQQMPSIRAAHVDGDPSISPPIKARRTNKKITPPHGGALIKKLFKRKPNSIPTAADAVRISCQLDQSTPDRQVQQEQRSQQGELHAILGLRPWQRRNDALHEAQSCPPDRVTAEDLTRSVRASVIRDEVSQFPTHNMKLAIPSSTQSRPGSY